MNLKLKDLKEQIAKIEAEHGPEALELEIATTEDHEYWGNVLNKASGISLTVAQIDGPKQGSRKCLVIS
jgi:hypothetical protein